MSGDEYQPQGTWHFLVSWGVIGCGRSSGCVTTDVSHVTCPECKDYVHWWRASR